MRGGLGRRAPRLPLGAGVGHRGQDAPPLRLKLGAVPLRLSSSRGRAERWRPRRGGPRHPGYRASDSDGLTVSAQCPLNTRLAAVEGRLQPRRPSAYTSPHRGAGQPLSPPTPVSRTPGTDGQNRDAGHRPLPAALRSAPPLQAGPTSCACSGGGAPQRQPISEGYLGTAPEILAGGGAGGRTSWGAKRREAGGKSRSAVELCS